MLRIKCKEYGVFCWEVYPRFKTSALMADMLNVILIKS